MLFNSAEKWTFESLLTLHLRQPEDLWPAICALFTLGWVVLLWRKVHHALGDEISQWFKGFVLKLRAGNEEGLWEDIVEETQALNTVESFSEILQLKEKCYILKGEVEALKKEAKWCSERQVQLHDLEVFFIQMKVFLDVSALHALPKD